MELPVVLVLVLVLVAAAETAAFVVRALAVEEQQLFMDSDR